MLLIRLHDDLVDAECGVPIPLPDGTIFWICLLAFIDDLLLLADEASKLQKAFDIVAAWAKRIRMRINVGVDKTAVMVISGAAPSPDFWTICGSVIPVVSQYKYLGIVLCASGSWKPFLKAFCDKTRARTIELIRWARANSVTSDVVSRLWLIYVETGAAWVLAIAPLTPSQLQGLNVPQRNAARMILGHNRRSPVPAPCVELGWMLWSSSAKGRRLSLLGRLFSSGDEIVLLLLQAGAAFPGSWTSSACKIATSLTTDDSLPTQLHEWRSSCKTWKSDALACDLEELCLSCHSHPNLSSYRRPGLQSSEPYGINRMIHDKSIGAEVGRVVGRLLCGGQGLRGGDPVMPSAVCVRAACLACLLTGCRRSETLNHFLFHCQLTKPVRDRPLVGELWQIMDPVVTLDCDVWSFQKQRISRRAIGSMWLARCQLMQKEGGANRRGRDERFSELRKSAS
ncbi:unnamed protein product [Polarella glacialis]|uniref:Reverse transcriptase domain-containing protein n=1 Tax=Polarella glacialis TaxID=89957 RepID=A0A813LV64_POLGL|nr:unnamed protein product [Polarella glacialis]